MGLTDAMFALQYFFTKAKADPNLDKSHLAVYIALLERWSEQGCSQRFHMFAKDGARAARVSIRTYYQCVADLSELGYIRYQPSFRNDLGSLIFFLSAQSRVGKG